MRLRMRIERNALPTVQTVWPVKDTSCTVAELLQQINNVFPLESDTWGYEDYALTLAGYDLLHYHVVKEALKDEDELAIKPLKWEDLKVRMLTGRNQISVDGRHLVDGVPFGRPALRTTRPEVRIPPRKKRKLSQGEEQVNGDYEVVNGVEEDEVTAPLMLADGTGEADEEGYSDMDDDPDFAALDNMSISSQGSWHSNASSTDISTDSSSSEDDSSDNSSSESDSSDSSSESDDEEAWEGIANGEPAPTAPKTKKALPNGDATSKQKSPPKTGAASRTTQQPSATDDNDPLSSTGGPSASAVTGIPHDGKSVTHSRNARRREAKRLKYIKSSGALPQDTTLAQFREILNSAPDADIDGDTEVDDQAEVNEATETADASGEVNASDTAANHMQQAAETTQVPTETEPPKKKKKAKKVSFTPETGAGIEEQRQQLVSAINSGGIDVSGKDGAQDDEPPEELTSRDQAASGQDTTNATVMMPRSVSAAARRSKLDIAGSQRLLFGSLGVRVPKTQEEKDKLQQRLAERAQRKAVREAGTAQTNGDAEPNVTTANAASAPAEDEGSWRDKINLTAVECVDEDVTLSEPPFPFHQRWDPQYNRRGKKRANSTYMDNGGKKRKRGQQQPLDESYDKYNADGYGDALNYDEEGEDEYWEDGALLNGDQEGNDDEEDVSNTLEDDFPALPEDLTTLPLLTASEAKTNDIITFTELACDASTGWQPQTTARTAKVLDPPSASTNVDLTCRIQLSTRDVKPPIYDEDGNRVYSKFEMPQEEGEDERVREVAWGVLGEVRVVRKAEG